MVMEEELDTISSVVVVVPPQTDEVFEGALQGEIEIIEEPPEIENGEVVALEDVSINPVNINL